MDEIELFIDLLITLRALPQSLEWKYERSLALFRLMEFANRIGRSDLYIRFVHQLVTLALEAKDYLTAGYGTKLHAEVYSWSMGGELVDEFPEMGLPPQSQFERKEALLYHVMDHFGKST
jgi:dedicator of cytokinesis protein 3